VSSLFSVPIHEHHGETVCMAGYGGDRSNMPLNISSLGKNGWGQCTGSQLFPDLQPCAFLSSLPFRPIEHEMQPLFTLSLRSSQTLGRIQTKSKKKDRSNQDSSSCSSYQTQKRVKEAQSRYSTQCKGCDESNPIENF